MDRTAWIVITLCVIGLVVWEIYISRQMPARPAVAPAPSVTPLLSATPIAASSPAQAPLAAASPAAVVASFAQKTETLRNRDVELHLTNRGGGIAEAVFLNHKAERNEPVVVNSPERMPIGAIIDDPAAPVLPEYKLTRQGDAVECEFDTPERAVIRKRFFFPSAPETKDNFVVELDVDVQNNGTQPYGKAGYFVSLGATIPLHARDYPYYTRLVWCIDGKARDRNVGSFQGSSGFLGLYPRAPQPFFQQDLSNAEWTAVTDQFFATLIAPLTAKANGIWGRSFVISPEQKTSGIEGAMHMPGFQLQPGQSYTAKFQVYSGPKIYHRLAQLEHNEAEIMNFGVFKVVSQFLLNFLNTIHSVVKDYGVAILILTAIIRLVLWPLQSKANRSMRQTALLAPKMQELREKYKDDPTRMNQEVMKLYKEYGINPVGGCLPMAIQIPIFFGLYQMLAQAVEMRNAKFLWVRDLSQPDTVAQLPVLGWNINIIPLCMAATQIWLMAMTPKTGDATQRRVMMFTPLIFLFICYNFAAALALYYTTQNLFSILQFYLNKKQPMPALEKHAAAGKRKR
jgi:YidC/Oxa1 family membrane protein insertase